MTNRQKIKKVLPWLVLLAAYLCSVAFWGMYGAHNLIADDSAEMILAAQLNEERRIITEEWFYSNELRLASPVQLYQLSLLVFPNDWQAARTLAVAIAMLVMLSALAYAARGLGLKKSLPWLCAVFALPFSGAYTWLITYQCHYWAHWIASLLMLGMLARCGAAEGRRRVGLYIALSVTAFVAGLNGVRIMMMFVVPVFAAVVLMAALACKAHPTFREAAHEPEMRMLLPALLTTVSAGAGYIVNMTVLSARYSYYNYSLESLRKFFLSDFLHQVDGLVDLFGYQPGASFFSLQGLSSFMALGIVIMLFLAMARMFSRWGALSAQLRLLLMTTTMAVALGMVLNVVLGQILARYFLVGILLMMVTLAAALETEPCKNEALRAMVSLAVMGCLAFQALCGVLYGYTQGRVNYEMAAQWLLERGYTQGFATYWNALPITEASDGQIEMWSLRVGGVDKLEVFTMNQAKEHFQNDPEGRVFLLVDEIENQSDSPLLDEQYLADENMIGWSYYIYEYESAAQMRELIAQGANP